MAIIDRIKFDGLRSRDWLIYKYPSEEFVTGSQLIVSEGQVAIFIKGGTVCDIFSAGTYTLTTNNLPLVQSFLNLPFGGRTPFTAEIYFLNTVTKLDMNWGTSDPIQMIDPKYFVRLHIRAFGQFAMKLEDYERFFTELIGAMDLREIIHYDKIMDYFRGILVTKVKTIISSIIINEKISALEITPHLEDISNHVMTELSDDFRQYGVSISNFQIQSINFPNEDFEKINEILEDKAAFELMGDQRYATKRSFDVYEGAAKNENGVAGSVFAGGIGLSAGLEAGKQMNSTVSSPNQTTEGIFCPNCHTVAAWNSKFCSACGTALHESLKAEVTCPNCGSLNPDGTKFCSQCGTPLGPKTCVCGAVLSPNAKFCTECGKKQ